MTNETVKCPYTQQICIYSDVIDIQCEGCPAYDEWYEKCEWAGEI